MREAGWAENREKGEGKTESDRKKIESCRFSSALLFLWLGKSLFISLLSSFVNTAGSVSKQGLRASNGCTSSHGLEKCNHMGFLLQKSFLFVLLLNLRIPRVSPQTFCSLLLPSSSWVVSPFLALISKSPLSDINAASPASQGCCLHGLSFPSYGFQPICIFGSKVCFLFAAYTWVLFHVLIWSDNPCLLTGLGNYL